MYPTVLRMITVYNHDLYGADALIKLSVTEETKEVLFTYFKNVFVAFPSTKIQWRQSNGKWWCHCFR